MVASTGEAVVYWLPMVLLVVAWFLFFLRMRSGPKYIREMNANFSRQNEEIISLLREIKNSLENRKP